MKISEYKNEDALDLLVDLIEPTAKIFSDKELAKAVQRKCTKIEAVKIAIKNHEREVIEILARLDDTPVEEYQCTVVSITMKLLEILNDKELTDFFTSQGQMVEQTSSTSATESIKVKGK